MATSDIISLGIRCTVNGEQVERNIQSAELWDASDRCVMSAPLYAGVEIITELVYENAYSLWRRSDMLANISDEPVIICHPVLTMHIHTDVCKVEAYQSEWCREFNGIEIGVPGAIGSKGRSCRGYQPYFRVALPCGVMIVNVLPHGNWRVAFEKADADKVTVSLDRYDDNLQIHLEPGEQFPLRLDCLIQIVDAASAPTAGRDVQFYALERLQRRKANPLPVVYNTWFDRFAKISIESMITQLEAATQVGCEVFVIDAGWFGHAGHNWEMVGDWCENPEVFSEVSLAQFAGIVRSKGLDFGIWMEPERVHAEAPVRLSHPEWFIQCDSSLYYYPDLLNDSAREWVFSEICRVVENYGVRWLKLDCNNDFSPDPAYQGRQNRIGALYDIVDRLTQRFPETVFECCASGGMSADILTVARFHTHFLSDTVDPLDTVRLSVAAACRLSPLMSGKWAALYPASGFTLYDQEPFYTGDLVLCPATATTSQVTSWEIDFAMRAAMTGIMGLTGNIAGLSGRIKQRLTEHIVFYKKHRQFIQNSGAIPLTPVLSIDDRRSFAAIQLSGRHLNQNMIFAYNPGSPESTFVVYPKMLRADVIYNISSTGGDINGILMSGDNITEGIEISCPTGHAEVILIDAADLRDAHGIYAKNDGN